MISALISLTCAVLVCAKMARDLRPMLREEIRKSVQEVLDEHERKERMRRAGYNGRGAKAL